MSEIKKSILYSPCLWIGALLLLNMVSCTEEKSLTEREVTIQLLTDNNEKYWMVDQTTIDGNGVTLSTCDSSYVLLLKADFTWKELNFKLQCNQGGFGSWSLNDENNVLSISYFNPNTGMSAERHFEIEELSENYFAYQIAQNNRLKYVRLKRRQSQ